MQVYLYKHKKKIVFLLLIGLGVSLFLKVTLNIGWKAFVSDIFFCMATIFLIYGLWEFVLKVGFFNSLVYGSKRLKKIIFPKKDKEEHLEDEYDDDYLTFTKKRKKDRNIAEPLFIGSFFFIISILVSLILWMFLLAEYDLNILLRKNFKEGDKRLL